MQPKIHEYKSVGAMRESQSYVRSHPPYKVSFVSCDCLAMNGFAFAQRIIPINQAFNESNWEKNGQPGHTTCKATWALISLAMFESLDLSVFFIYIWMILRGLAGLFCSLALICKPQNVKKRIVQANNRINLKTFVLAKEQ